MNYCLLIAFKHTVFCVLIFFLVRKSLRRWKIHLQNLNDIHPIHFRRRKIVFFLNKLDFKKYLYIYLICADKKLKIFTWLSVISVATF